MLLAKNISAHKCKRYKCNIIEVYKNISHVSLRESRCKIIILFSNFKFLKAKSSIKFPKTYCIIVTKIVDVKSFN